MTLVGPQAINASSTYGVDLSAENNYGLGTGGPVSALQRNNVALAGSAARPTLSIWLIAGLVLAAVVYL